MPGIHNKRHAALCFAALVALFGWGTHGTNASRESDPWSAFYPPPDRQHDWLQLTSGEWLKGDLRAMYSDTLEFDSAELDLQEIDFEDVARLRTRNTQTVMIEKGKRETAVLHGRLEVEGERTILYKDDKQTEIQRDQIISIAGEAQRRRDLWSGTAALGVNVRGGNTETTDTTIMANLKRRTAITRFNAGYIANYGRSLETETANNQRFNGYFDWFITGRFYWQVVTGEYYRDPFSNIDGQYSVGSGIGYDIMDTAKTQWSVGAGLGYQVHNFSSVEAGKGDRSNSAYVTASTHLEHEIRGDLDFIYDFSVRGLSKENGRYTHRMFTQLSFDLVHNLDLDVSVVWDRIGDPIAKADGTIPKKDDYQLIVSLAYEF